MMEALPKGGQVVIGSSSKIEVEKYKQGDYNHQPVNWIGKHFS